MPEPSIHRAVSEVRGFNYVPSFCRTGFELWTRFDERIFRDELMRARDYFPGINTIRIFLDQHAYEIEPAAFLERIAIATDAIDAIGARFIPVLFNRWHHTGGDWGGVYIDHISPEVHISGRADRFRPYLEALIPTFRDDPRILLIDLCNEPQIRWKHELELQHKRDEFDWLAWTAEHVRSLDPTHPITIGTMVFDDVEIFEPLVDVVSCHPYSGWRDGRLGKDVDRVLALSDKPVLASETTDGAEDDRERGEIIEKTLGALKARQVGWIAWTLNWAPRANSRRGDPYNGGHSYMAYIEEDGSLRPYHDAFNAF